jgi:hypothetical protein
MLPEDGFSAKWGARFWYPSMSLWLIPTLNIELSAVPP